MFVHGRAVSGGFVLGAVGASTRNGYATLGLRGLTLRVETRSAVSSRVNWLIWSTMVAILGFAGAAAASVDCHLRACCRRETEARAGEARAARAQTRSADWHESDMAGGMVGVRWEVCNCRTRSKSVVVRVSRRQNLEARRCLTRHRVHRPSSTQEIILAAGKA